MKTSQLLHVFAQLQPGSLPGPSIVRFKGLHEGFYDFAVVVKLTLGTDYQVRVVFRDPLDYNRSFAVGGPQNGTFGSLCQKLTLSFSLSKTDFLIFLVKTSFSHFPCQKLTLSFSFSKLASAIFFVKNRLNQFPCEKQTQSFSLCKMESAIFRNNCQRTLFYST